MKKHAAERDPGQNANFSRRWHDDPPQVSDLERLGREVAPRIVEDVARRAIGQWLDRIYLIEERSTS